MLAVGIPVDRDHPFRFIVTSDSGLLAATLMCVHWSRHIKYVAIGSTTSAGRAMRRLHLPSADFSAEIPLC